MFLDVNMPEVDGFGVLLTLRADERTREIPVIRSRHKGARTIFTGLGLWEHATTSTSRGQREVAQHVGWPLEGRPGSLDQAEPEHPVAGRARRTGSLLQAYPDQPSRAGLSRDLSTTGWRVRSSQARREDIRTANFVE